MTLPRLRENLRAAAHANRAHWCRIGAGISAIVTLLILWIIMAGCLFRCGENSWLAPAGTAALAVISLLAARKMRSTPRG